MQPPSNPARASMPLPESPAGPTGDRTARFHQYADLALDWAGPGLAEWTGVSTAEWKQSPAVFWELIHVEDRPWLKTRLAAPIPVGQDRVSRFRIRNPATESVFHVLEIRRLHPVPANTSGLFEVLWIDQTEIDRLQCSLFAALSHKTVATFLPGYIHDLNNALVGIGSVGDLCFLELGPSHPLSESLALLKESTAKASLLVSNLSNLLSASPTGRQWHDLRELGRKVSDLIRPGLPRGVRLEASWGGSALPVLVERGELQQAVFHLVCCALSAMENQGVIRLETFSEEEVPEEPALAPSPTARPLVCLAVTHSSHDSDPTLAPRLIDQDFGLAFVDDFARRNGGILTVKAEPAGGRILKICLPLANLEEQTS